MIIHRDRVDQVRRRRPHRRGDDDAAGRIEPEAGFPHVPAVVAALGDDVDFFDAVLADIGDVAGAISAVETDAEGIAEAVCVNLAQTGDAIEGVVERDAVLAIGGVARVHVDAMQLAENAHRALRVAARDVAVGDIVRGTAIAQGEVEETVWPEAHHAAVMVGLGFVDAENFAAARHVHAIAVGGINAPLGDDGLVIGQRADVHRSGEVGRAGVRLGGVSIDERVGGEVGMHGDAEQTALVVIVSGIGDQQSAQVQEWRRATTTSIHDPDDAGLVIDEKASAAVIRGREA